MTPYYTDPLVTLYLGDCLDVMPTLETESVDAVVTDPPYGLGFMGKVWDHGVPATPFWAEMYRAAKPGAYLLAFGGTRTIHRIMTNIEDAGWEIRDMLSWIYASGFPKSLDVSKALDKVAGAEREVLSIRQKRGALGGVAYAQDAWTLTQANQPLDLPVTAPATDLARKWEGWGTALKPAHEPIVMARKPLVGTVAQNVTRYGTGALNIDGTRIPSDRQDTRHGGGIRGNGSSYELDPDAKGYDLPSGRWPSNVLLSDPELFDELNPAVVGSGAVTASGDAHVLRRGASTGAGMGYGSSAAGDVLDATYGDSGGYSRFFIVPKSPRHERNRGLRERSSHPTVKPVDLMRHLVRLVTPPGGVTLDPFLGSGTTALAASEEGFRCIGIEREADYLEIAKGRLIATPMGLGLDVPTGTAPRKVSGGGTRRVDQPPNPHGSTDEAA